MDWLPTSGSTVTGNVAVAGVVWLALAWHLHRRGRNAVYVAFFTVFFVYGFKVLDYTLFQFQSLLLLQHFDPNLILNGVPNDERLNLVPLVALESADVRTSLLNVAMMVPFGLGLPFLTRLRWGSVVSAGAMVSPRSAACGFTSMSTIARHRAKSSASWTRRCPRCFFSTATCSASATP